MIYIRIMNFLYPSQHLKHYIYNLGLAKTLLFLFTVLEEVPEWSIFYYNEDFIANYDSFFYYINFGSWL